MVVIHKRQAHAAFFSADSHRLGHVLELAFTFVMEKLHPIAQANCQIGLAVIVEIAGRTSEAAPSEMDTCFLGHIVESSIAHAAQQPARAVRRTAYEEKIGLAIAIIVEEASASARSNLDAASPRTFWHERIRLRRKSHRNCSRHIDNRTQRQLRERVTPLIAVARAERRS